MHTAAACLVAMLGLAGPLAAGVAAEEPAAAAQPRVLPAVPLPRPTAPGPTAVPASRPMPDWKLIGGIAAAFIAVVSVRMLANRRVATLPTDVFDILGEGRLGGQHAVRIVRFGPKTLLVSVSASGCQTLAELSDPQATECIVAACRGLQAPLRPPHMPRPGAGRPSPAAAVPSSRVMADSRPTAGEAA